MGLTSSKSIKIPKRIGQDKRLQAFVAILVIGLGISLSQAFKIYVINSEYKQPSNLRLFPILFEYVAFAVIAYLFPWSWNVRKDEKRRNIIRVLLSGVAFVVIYLAVLSSLEWLTSLYQYNYWHGFVFTVLHSGFQVFMIYALISAAINLLGVTRNGERKFLKHLMVKDKGMTSFIDVGNVSFLEANDNYVSVALNNGKQQLIRQTLGALEKELDPALFQRVHRKYILNLSQVASWKPDPNGGYVIVLKEGRELKMSKSYKDKLHFLSARK